MAGRRLSRNTKIAIGVAAGAAAIGAGYYLYKRKAAAAGATSCWSPVTPPFTLAPGHYRLEMPVPANQQAAFVQQWPTLTAALPKLLQQLPGLTIVGMWYGSNAFPAGTPLPADWPSSAAPGAMLRVDVLNPYNGKGPVTSMTGGSLWRCSTGPTPATQQLPANAAQTLLAVLAQSGLAPTATTAPGPSSTPQQGTAFRPGTRFSLP